MIIRERASEFVMISQHDHAFLSGEIAKYIQKRFFLSEEYIEEVLLAVFEHDRGWISIDEKPLWSESGLAPVSFAEYPHLAKLTAYQKGVDEVEVISLYAALLCSLHYCSFFTKATDDESLHFVKLEKERQSRIRKQLQVNTPVIRQHFRLLQFCDDFSLYICLNEPGIKRDDEHPWFKNGFINSGWLSNGEDIVAEWIDSENVKLSSFPFMKEFQASIDFKTVPKTGIHKWGIKKAFESCSKQKQFIRFCR
ncbi:DUF3891 family protein [Halalkalibacter krulwichiae]|uniref:DUF3891 family protein n=1 Tax=Halalkalibacter krulwichiae TaxID=199441 RepID=A0A1Y9TH79_9BACI|nr:DUF3891 family protein [Halalkalibacter krulwichiae]ARK28419.1 hypothetical protein BkAM31D_00185 [Halalkalibacter krulwichiae]